MEEIRIQKFLSDCGVISRRAAEKEILAGKVKINGIAAEIGQKIDPKTDVVTYKGQRVSQKNKKVYIMLNKPQGYVTTMSDEHSRKCVAELVKDVGTRVYPIGRLDMESEGLLLFTDDGEFANVMMHPSGEVKKIYHVKVDREITPEEKKTLSSPMIIDDYEILPADVEIISRKNGQTLMRMAISEGRNRQIRKMCEQLELNVLSLKRVQIGEIKLGDLRPGKWKYLSAEQVNSLKKGKGKNEKSKISGRKTK